MTTFNPRDWPRLPDWLDPHQGRRSPREINREALERCCMVVAFCLCFAALAPPGPVALRVRRSAVPGWDRVHQPCAHAGRPAAGVASDHLGRGGIFVHRKPRAVPLAWAISSQLKSPSQSASRTVAQWRQGSPCSLQRRSVDVEAASGTDRDGGLSLWSGSASLPGSSVLKRRRILP